jgi:two-component system chemotaxis sensor kinase CheA
MDEVVKEFLIESHENLNQLDQDLIELEKSPGSQELLASVFRAIHTIKGVSGFLDFSRLERLTHAGEELLSRLRDGELKLSSPIVSALLAMIDAIRAMLTRVEADGNDGTIDYGDIIEKLELLCAGEGVSHPSAPEASAPAPAPIPAPSPIAASGAPPVGAAANVSASDSPSGRGDHPAADSQSAAEADHAASAATESAVRVNVTALDRLMNLVGELVLVRNQILQFAAGREDTALLSASQRLNLITTELQEGIMKTRMQPIGNIWNKFPRIVRDLAVACGKQVKIEMEGEETELDKTLIEAIRDPLTHIVRNAVDHGIELPAARMACGKPVEGRLKLRALHESGQVIIEVGEDGAGIDHERVREVAIERGIITSEQASRMTENDLSKLVFRAGFSTAREVTHISGRGVGMDVVRNNIEKIGGTVDIHSRRNEGTTLRIKIPLTLAIIPALVVTCAGDRYAIPQINLIELVRLDGDENGRRIEMVHGAPVYRLRGNLLPLVYLREVLKVEAERESSDSGERASHIVVLQVGEQQFGLVVDEVNDTEEIVVKPLGKRFKGMNAFAGATIMGDGRVALILDVLGVVQLASVGAESDANAHAEDQKAAPAENRRQRLLLCRAGNSDRIAVPLALVARLEEFPRSSIERAAGCNVVGYRDQILPLVDLGEIAGSAEKADNGTNDPVQVVVFDDGNHLVGVIVREIVDIVEEEALAVQLSSRTDLIGSALVAKKATDFLDLRAVFEAARKRWYDAKPAAEIERTSVLLIDQSSFTRGLVRSYLEMAGHKVFEAGNAAEAIDRFAHYQIRIAMVSANLPGNGAVFEQIRKRASDSGVALIGLVDDRGEISPETAMRYASCHFKSDRQAILDAIEQIIHPSAHSGAETQHHTAGAQA